MISGKKYYRYNGCTGRFDECKFIRKMKVKKPGLFYGEYVEYMLTHNGVIKSERVFYFKRDWRISIEAARKKAISGFQSYINRINKAAKEFKND